MFLFSTCAVSSAPQNLSDAFPSIQLPDSHLYLQTVHLAPAGLCCIGASGEPKWVYNEGIGWYISVGVIEGKK